MYISYSACAMHGYFSSLAFVVFVVDEGVFAIKLSFIWGKSLDYPGNEPGGCCYSPGTYVSIFEQGGQVVWALPVYEVGPIQPFKGVFPKHIPELVDNSSNGGHDEYALKGRKNSVSMTDCPLQGLN